VQHNRKSYTVDVKAATADGVLQAIFKLTGRTDWVYTMIDGDKAPREVTADFAANNLLFSGTNVQRAKLVCNPSAATSKSTSGDRTSSSRNA